MGQRGWNLKQPFKIIQTRADHPQWKGDAASKGAKNMRARKWFALVGMCERCHVKPARDRHHKDGNPGNNTRENIAFLCRHCHMEVDGRLAHLAEVSRLNHKPQPAKPCINCRVPSKPLRKGRCVNCTAYFWRTGKERPIRSQGADRDLLAQMYADYQSGLSLKTVGDKYGKSETTVLQWFQRAELPRRQSWERVDRKKE